MTKSSDILLISFHPEFTWHRYEGCGRYDDVCNKFPAGFEFERLPDEEAVTDTIAAHDFYLEKRLKECGLEASRISWTHHIIRQSCFEDVLDPTDPDRQVFEHGSDFEVSAGLARLAEVKLHIKRMELAGKIAAQRKKEEEDRSRRQDREAQILEANERAQYEALRAKYGEKDG